jgi:RNA polymerase sigma factor (sigma-70 family)
VIIINYNKLFKKHEIEIYYYANRIRFQDIEDSIQEIKLYVYKNIYRFDPSKASFKYYIHILILTSFRKIVYDKNKQQVFEESFQVLCGDHSKNEEECDKNFDLTLSKIISKLNPEIKIVVFYSLLYNKGEKNYYEIAEMLNLKYTSFLNHVKTVKKVVKEVINDQK